MPERSLDEFGDELTGADSPTIGLSPDERTHYGHVRYAAGNHDESIVWYDPRDGRERFWLGRDVDVDDLEDEDDRVLRGVSIGAFRPESHGDPAARYIVREHLAALEVFRDYQGGELTETHRRVGSLVRSEVFEGIEAARDWCRENVPDYAEAPRRDAVSERASVGGWS